MKTRQVSVALSLSGRDKGRLFAVLEESEGFALIADGRLRKLQKPKKKKIKHLKMLGKVELQDYAFLSDRALWRALRKFQAESEAAAEGGFKLVQG